MSAAWRKAGQLELLPSDRLTTSAGVALAGTPRTAPPGRPRDRVRDVRVAPAASCRGRGAAGPSSRARCRTRRSRCSRSPPRSRSRASRASWSCAPSSGPRPGRADTKSPGSDGSASRPSPSLPLQASAMKSYPATVWPARSACVRIPVSRTATTVPAPVAVAQAPTRRCRTASRPLRRAGPTAGLAYVSFGSASIVAIGSASASTTPGDAFSRASVAFAFRAERLLEAVDGRRAGGAERRGRRRPAWPAAPRERRPRAAGCRGPRGDRGGCRGEVVGGPADDDLVGRRGPTMARPGRAGPAADAGATTPAVATTTRTTRRRRRRRAGRVAGVPDASGAAYATSTPGIGRSTQGQAQARADRAAQYVLGRLRDPRAAPRPRRPAPGATSTAAAFDAQLARASRRPTARRRPTGGRARRRARRVARPSRALGGGRDRRRADGVLEQPAVRERLLDDDAPPRRVRLRERGARRRLEQVPRRLDAGERVDAVDADIERGADTSRLARPADAQPDDEAVLGAEAGELGEHGRVGEDPALERRRVDLVQPKPRPEQHARLRQLRAQHRERVVLDLVDRRVHPPLADVPVAPLRADRDPRRVDRAGAEPRGEEPLRVAIRAGRVEIADPGRPGRVEDLVAARLHRLDRAVRPSPRSWSRPA